MFAKIALLSMVFVAGCAAKTPSLSISSTHPANPLAPQAERLETAELHPEPQDASRTTSTSSRAEIEAHDHPSKPDDPAPPSGGYVCPMHPQVRSDTPGDCPQCGMRLVAGTADE